MSAVATPPARPAPPPAAPVITPDDLLAMPDEGRGYELVDGRLQECSVSAKSSRLGAGMVRLLWNHAEAHRPGWVYGSDASFLCFPEHPGRVRRADAAYIALERFTVEQYETEGHISVCPDLVVEVVSPNDVASDVNRKVEEWLRAGARLVWVIDPDPRLAFAHRPDGVEVRREADALTGDPVLPGLVVPLADLFRLPTAG
jgi:Uma2 family endonuclease